MTASLKNVWRKKNAGTLPEITQKACEEFVAFGTRRHHHRGIKRFHPNMGKY
ncbi:hypothetical protein ACR79T_04430 [Sphingobacterium spiritivorum]|uniref:hypothetical protein n=1 Tax=Sphingobacterium spiritivorum TaxID=258 RepID=UPI003DA5A83B